MKVLVFSVIASIAVDQTLWPQVVSTAPSLVFIIWFSWRGRLGGQSRGAINSIGNTRRLGEWTCLELLRPKGSIARPRIFYVLGWSAPAGFYVCTHFMQCDGIWWSQYFKVLAWYYKCFACTARRYSSWLHTILFVLCKFFFFFLLILCRIDKKKLKLYLLCT